MANFLRENAPILGIFHHIPPKDPPNERQWKKIISIFPIPIPIPPHVCILSLFRPLAAEFPYISCIHPYITSTNGLGPKRLRDWANAVEIQSKIT